VYIKVVTDHHILVRNLMEVLRAFSDKGKYRKQLPCNRRRIVKVQRTTQSPQNPHPPPLLRYFRFYCVYAKTETCGIIQASNTPDFVHLVDSSSVGGASVRNGASICLSRDGMAVGVTVTGGAIAEAPVGIILGVRA